MAENLIIEEGGKERKYAVLFKQVQAVVAAEQDPTAVMANVSCMIHLTFGFWWTGFYRVVNDRGEDELVLGPFQGPMACTRIKKGRGVCGTAWKQEQTIVVEDVEKFDGHIACSSESKSEIVVPIRKNGVVTGVLDIDSEKLNTFDNTDAIWLEKIVNLL